MTRNYTRSLNKKKKKKKKKKRKEKRTVGKEDDAGEFRYIHSVEGPLGCSNNQTAFLATRHFCSPLVGLRNANRKLAD